MRAAPAYLATVRAYGFPRVHPFTPILGAGGRGGPVDDDRTRAEIAPAASYAPDERYVLFELFVSEARCNGYGDVSLPPTTRWTTADPADRA